MHPYQMNQWNADQQKQLNQETGQALLSDEQTLALFSQDFGKLIHSKPAFVAVPKTDAELVQLISFAYKHQLPVTIRSYGLSQGGQSLPVSGGLVLSMQHFKVVGICENDSIWADTCASWADVLAETLKHSKVPLVLPYNTNLSVGGVISVGGVGAASFKQGTITAHIDALEVVDGCGRQQIVTPADELFHACLSGQGQFAVIIRAKIKLRAAKAQVKTCYLVYNNLFAWFSDMERLKATADYLELFCSPSIQGSIVKQGARVPAVQWLYGLHASIEFEEQSPQTSRMLEGLTPMNILHTQEESLESYIYRHNPRFETMRLLGQWEQLHPWYECFVPAGQLLGHLPGLLERLPVYYANLVHVVPIAKKQAGFLMLPQDEVFCSFMILNPGVPEALKDGCLSAIKALDQTLLSLGGKRYLSGYLGEALQPSYWQQHYGSVYQQWVAMKNTYDPAGIFVSKIRETVA